MSFSESNKPVYKLPEETRKRIQNLARQLNCSEQEAEEGLLNSFLDLIENPDATELTGFAKEARAKLYSRKH